VLLLKDNSPDAEAVDKESALHPKSKHHRKRMNSRESDNDEGITEEDAAQEDKALEESFKAYLQTPAGMATLQVWQYWLWDSLF
jgi:hypothetical protein